MKATKGPSCPCPLCTSPTNIIIKKNTMTWNTVCRTILFCLNNSIKGIIFDTPPTPTSLTYYSFNNHIVPFFQTHNTFFSTFPCVKRNTPEKCKKSLLDSLSHSQDFLSSKTQHGIIGYWHLKNADKAPWEKSRFDEIDPKEYFKSCNTKLDEITNNLERYKDVDLSTFPDLSEMYQSLMEKIKKANVIRKKLDGVLAQK
ncbi:hypothetical protein EIN_187170 [Entamoeba invadens IP1]|uniref:hypothetical protein n=1 Tax=Entamoeba invadens IP1 TaxID=370355 RepID=UPI0002C3EEED|nr:hypothetical protein EIN_187170 [Entamoeba invadens IP1]ELP94260.1 hypothetical protein EIN_187170 [Entamoeba invadens IP1]|eukprot:XP_004261031.1 hypothetical protein EIN_187170 [Entamoeba invadens IP1]